jgi:hypothetical protein
LLQDATASREDAEDGSFELIFQAAEWRKKIQADDIAAISILFVLVF